MAYEERSRTRISWVGDSDVGKRQGWLPRDRERHGSDVLLRQHVDEDPSADSRLHRRHGRHVVVDQILDRR